MVSYPALRIHNVHAFATIASLALFGCVKIREESKRSPQPASVLTPDDTVGGDDEGTIDSSVQRLQGEIVFVEGSRLDLGLHDVGKRHEFELTLEKTGEAPITLTSVRFSSPEFALSGDIPGDGGDCAGAFAVCTLRIGFTPNSVQTYESSATIEYTADGEPKAASTTIVGAGLVALGQPDINSNMGARRGTRALRALATDGTRLIGAEPHGNRILIWNAIPDSVDDLPDLVLGQPDLHTSVDNMDTTAGTLEYPHGLWTDGTRLIVSEENNSRVLIWRTFPTRNRQPADVVLGQPDMESNTRNNGGISASSLDRPSDVLVVNGKLFVVDQYNSRILIWNSVPDSNMHPADLVLGQPSFTTVGINEGGLSASTFAIPGKVTSDGTRLFVSDSFNNRVLVWNSLPTINGQVADYVLGQPDLTSNTPNNGGVSAASMRVPLGIHLPAGRLVVNDYYNHRTLIWNSVPTTSSVPADIVLGQPDMTTVTVNTNGISGSSAYYPGHTLYIGGKLFITEWGNFRVLVWNTFPTSSGQSADWAMFQPSLTSADYLSARTDHAKSMLFPISIASDGTKLAVTDMGNHRVLLWSELPVSGATEPDVVIGQADKNDHAAPNSPTSSNMRSPRGVAIGGGRLAVVDSGHHRVLVWQQWPQSSGAAADLVLGQADFVSGIANAGGVSASSMSSPRDVAVVGSRLFVTDSANHRLLTWNALPTTNGSPASFALGQADLTSALPNGAGLSGKSLLDPGGLATFDGRLALADTGNHRVLVWNAAPTGADSVADGVYGQPTMTVGDLVAGAPTAASLKSPAGATWIGTHLAIADTLNNRIAIWTPSAVPQHTYATAVFAQKTFDTRLPNGGDAIRGDTLAEPTSMLAIGDRVVIVDSTNHRVLIIPAGVVIPD